MAIGSRWPARAARVNAAAPVLTALRSWLLFLTRYRRRRWRVAKVSGSDGHARIRWYDAKPTHEPQGAEYNEKSQKQHQQNLGINRLQQGLGINYLGINHLHRNTPVFIGTPVSSALSLRRSVYPGATRGSISHRIVEGGCGNPSFLLAKILVVRLRQFLCRLNECRCWHGATGLPSPTDPVRRTWLACELLPDRLNDSVVASAYGPSVPLLRRILEWRTRIRLGGGHHAQ